EKAVRFRSYDPPAEYHNSLQWLLRLPQRYPVPEVLSYSSLMENNKEAEPSLLYGLFRYTLGHFRDPPYSSEDHLLSAVPEEFQGSHRTFPVLSHILQDLSDVPKERQNPPDS